jgi:ribulose-bisphosphate carboxylase small chain
MSRTRNEAAPAAGRRFGTFSYLPAMQAADVRRQVEYLVARGWTAAIEHTEPERAATTYWYMWQLPMFGEKSVERILAQADACHRAHPAHLVRLIGYDSARQTQGTAMVVHRGTAG